MTIIQHLFNFLRKRSGQARILVLALTRELAIQVAEQEKELVKYTHLYMITINNRVSYINHAEIFNENQDIVVAITGGLLQHIKEKNFNCQTIKILILDKADRIFDIGVINNIKLLLKKHAGVNKIYYFSNIRRWSHSRFC